MALLFWALQFGVLGEFRNLIEKPRVFAPVLYMSPAVLGVFGPGFLHQALTL